MPSRSVHFRKNRHGWEPSNWRRNAEETAPHEESIEAACEVRRAERSLVTGIGGDVQDWVWGLMLVAIAGTSVAYFIAQWWYLRRNRDRRDERE